MCNGETTKPATPAATAAPPSHVALLSSPGMGHVAPVAELARRLHEAHGFTATILTYASSESAAQRALLATLPPAVCAATLPPVALDDLPAGSAVETLLSVEAQRSVPAVAAALTALRSNNLVAFVADLFGADALSAARDAGVPGYIFFPSNLLFLSLMLHLPRLDAELDAAAAGGGGGRKEFRDVAAIRLPGCAAVPGADVLQPLQDRGGEAYRWMVRHGERFRDAAGILVNTFDAVEPAAAALLRRPEPWRPPVYPIGPITTRPSTTAADDDDATGCIEWLDKQPERSVIFVSFGSAGALSATQTRELARGLELAGTRFLWVFRSPAGGDSTNPGESYCNGGSTTRRSSSTDGDEEALRWLPEGFVERTKATGRVVPGWAPQARVLAHGATAAMVTHCGWNSALESVASGVPMVAWPLYAEQRQNALLLCEGAGAALRPRARGAGGGAVVLAEDVAAVVAEMVRGEMGKAARAKVAELRDAAAAALRPGGASHETLAQVVSEWKGAAAAC